MSTPQTLTLVVQGPQAAQFGSRSQKSFHAKDGSIGRSEDCDWVLSASGVSRVHAMVRYLNGIYFIEDRSTNGMLLNGSPLIKGDPAALKNGDRLQIDTFEVVARMEADSETIVQIGPPVAHPMPVPAPAAPPVSAAFNNDPLDFDFLNPIPAVSAPTPTPSRASSIDSLIPGMQQSAPASSDLDPLSFLDEPFGAPAPEPAPTPSWNHAPSVNDHFRPPTTDVRKQANTLPENWDLTTGDFAPAPVAPAPPPAPEPVVASPPPPPPQVAVPIPSPAPVGALPQDVDQIFRIVVDGVMDVLRARAEIKNTFRLPVTIIQRSENNPLKFALGTDEAMQKILGPANPGFLSGTAAFQDAFEDIRLHQMAMLAGVRAGFEALLMHFNPDRFEHEVDGGKRGGVAFGAKGKYWDKYRDNFEGLVKNPDDTFRRLFGDEFARAYEEQLARLKGSRRK